MDRALTPTLDASWVPAQIRWTAAGPMVDWCHLGDLRFTAPFFEQTIGTAMRHPFNLLFGRSTPLQAFTAGDVELRPAGLIFHMSRCGSTLLARMLAVLPRNVVLSEPGPLDQVLRVPSRVAGVTPDMLVGWMRAMTAALGRRRHAEQRDLFIKLEGWHILLLPLIRRAFPDVPWLFLYREPVEVLVSLARQRPRQMMFGGLDPTLLGIAPPEAAAMSPDRYCALVIERICRAALAHAAADGGLLIEYRELPDPALTRMLDHFGLHCDSDDLARMRETAGRDAKDPNRPYADDSAAKRNAASDEIRDLAATVLAPLYRRLEDMRSRS